MKSEKKAEKSATIATNVIEAAAQRGMVNLPTCFFESQLTKGRPMMASTADTSIYITTDLKYHIKNSIPVVMAIPTKKRNVFCGVYVIA